MIIKLVSRVPLHNNLFCAKFKKVLGLILHLKTHSCKLLDWVSVITYSVTPTALLNWRNILELKLQARNKGEVTLRIPGNFFKTFDTVRSRILITKLFCFVFCFCFVFFQRPSLVAYQLTKQLFPLRSNVMNRHQTHYAANLHFGLKSWTNAF